MLKYVCWDAVIGMALCTSMLQHTYCHDSMSSSYAQLHLGKESAQSKKQNHENIFSSSPNTPHFIQILIASDSLVVLLTDQCPGHSCNRVGHATTVNNLEQPGSHIVLSNHDPPVLECTAGTVQGSALPTYHLVTIW